MPSPATEMGMTLRDWFAGQVVGDVFRRQLRVQNSEDDTFAGQVALTAYEIADAMLVEREDD